MDNFSRLKNEHHEFFKLPKLPYVLGNTTAIVLALDKNTSENHMKSMRRLREPFSCRKIGKHKEI